MKDPFGRGIIAGLIGVIAINLVEFVLLALKISETPLWQAGGLPFLSEKALKTPLGIAIGIFSHVFVAIVIGISIAYFITLTGNSLVIFKGMGISLIAGFFVLGILFPLRGLAEQMQQSPKDVLSAIIDHAVFGAVAGYVIKKLTPVPKKPSLKKAKKQVKSPDNTQDKEINKHKSIKPKKL